MRSEKPDGLGAYRPTGEGLVPGSRAWREEYGRKLDEARRQGITALNERVAKLKATSEFSDEKEFIATAKFFIEHGRRPTKEELEHLLQKTVKLELDEYAINLTLRHIFTYALKPLPTFEEVVDELRQAQEQQRKQHQKFREEEKLRKGSPTPKGTIIDLERVGDTNTFAYQSQEGKPTTEPEPQPLEPERVDAGGWGTRTPGSSVDDFLSLNGLRSPGLEYDPLQPSGLSSNDESCRLEQEQDEFRRRMQQEQDDLARRMQEDEDRRQEEARRQREMDDLFLLGGGLGDPFNLF